MSFSFIRVFPSVNIFDMINPEFHRVIGFIMLI